MKSVVSIFGLALILALGACSRESDPVGNAWSTFKGEGLNDSKAHYDVFKFFDNSHGVLAGYTSKNADFTSAANMRVNQFDALISTTHDGGRTWTEFEIGRGQVKEINYINGRYLYLKVVYNDKGIGNHKSAIYESAKLGGVNQTLYEPPADWFIKQIRFISDRKWLATVDVVRHNSPRENIVYTSNAGTTWDVLDDDNFRSDEYGHFYFEDSVYKIIKDLPKIIRYNIETKENHEIELEDGVVVQGHNGFNVVDGGKLWVVLKDMRGSYLARLHNNKIQERIQLPSTASKAYGLVLAFNIAGNDVNIVKIKHASMIGAPKSFFHSGDYGVTWCEETLPNDLFASSFAFKKNGEVLAYSGSGEFQKRN